MAAIVYLVDAPPGVRKTAAAEKIARQLGDVGARCKVASLEESLLALYPADAEFRRSSQAPLVALIGQHSPAEICTKWGLALRGALSLALGDEPDVVLLTCSLVYYRSETFEFYSPVDYTALREAKIDGILTLIDDIYDVYAHLSQSGEVFDVKDLISRVFPPSRRGTAESKDLSRLYKDALLIVVSSLIRILSWREKEIDASALVARALSTSSESLERNVLAVKHPVRTGTRLLLGERCTDFSLPLPCTAYISHPISRPRRYQREKGVWPPFVVELADFVRALEQEDLGGVAVAAIMPTAIDEYRLLSHAGTTLPHLSERWPIGDLRGLLYEPALPDNARGAWTARDLDRACLLQAFDPPLDSYGRRTGIPLPDAEVTGMLRTLEEAVRLHMANRDHLLVRQASRLVLYRPVYEEAKFSSGVENEIHTFQSCLRWDRVANNGASRKAVFVHARADAQKLFAEPESGSSAANSLERASIEFVKRVKDDCQRHHRPQPRHNPSNAAVAAALLDFESGRTSLERVYAEMFPPREGTIGVASDAPFAAMEDALRAAIDEARKIELTTSVDEDWTFAGSGAAGRRETGATTRESVVYHVELIDDPREGTFPTVPQLAEFLKRDLTR